MAATSILVDRRHFLAAAAGLAGTGLLAAPVRGFGWRPAPLFDISLAQWSLHNALFKKELDNLDFPQKARSFGIAASGASGVGRICRAAVAWSAWAAWPA